MENFVLDKGVTLRNAIKVEVEGETYYITKATTGYIVYNTIGAGIHVPEIESVEQQVGCKVGEDTFTIGCVTVPKHFLEIGKKAFKQKAEELEVKLVEKQNQREAIITNKDK